MHQLFSLVKLKLSKFNSTKFKFSRNENLFLFTFRRKRCHNKNAIKSCSLSISVEIFWHTLIYGMIPWPKLSYWQLYIWHILYQTYMYRDFSYHWRRFQVLTSISLPQQRLDAHTHTHTFEIHSFIHFLSYANSRILISRIIMKFILSKR